MKLVICLLPPDGVKLFFQLINLRYEKNRPLLQRIFLCLNGLKLFKIKKLINALRLFKLLESLIELKIKKKLSYSNLVIYGPKTYIFGGHCQKMIDFMILYVFSIEFKQRISLFTNVVFVCIY